MGTMKFCRVYINKITTPKQLCSKYKTIGLWQSTHIGSSPHPFWFICCIWYYRPNSTAVPTAWVGNQRCCIGLFQILFEYDETIRCYQWHTVIASKSVFRSASGISIWPNVINLVCNTTGYNSTEISTRFPYLYQWHSCTWPSNRTIRNHCT